MSLEIRLAREADLPQIEVLLREVHEVHAQGRPDIFRAGAQKYTRAELSALLLDETRPVYVACNGDAVLGYAFCVLEPLPRPSMQPVRTLYIDDLCVSHAARGQHVGTALYRHVLAEARRLGCYNVTLNVWACNEGARAFYEKCGLSVQKYHMEQIL